MANTIAGMFADPNSFRDERLNDLMKQRQAISNMGGSMNQLLGQVAAGGGATGAMMAEGLGGMFGLSTREEQKAAELQAMAENMDLTTSGGLAEFARMLNGLGYTTEAIKVLEKRDSVLDRERAEIDRQERIAKGDIRTMRRSIPVKTPVYNTKKTEIVGYRDDLKEVVWTQTWNPETQTWEPQNPPQEAITGGGAVGPIVQMPSGKNKAGDPIDPTKRATEASDVDYNTMTNSENKPVQGLYDSLRSWWDS